ncbi:hypothetical protein RF11_16418 [Thelohanellus kitauei]|uniref:Uncharacterized protein n=1 Tax=Thelohanellus kitauei TaxID=669202 RepID=A0A0C2N1A5_THEKT|nr:hypothetical protein RF11_16418 [Thelohanellus kitauei]
MATHWVLASRDSSKNLPYTQKGYSSVIHPGSDLQNSLFEMQSNMMLYEHSCQLKRGTIFLLLVSNRALRISKYSFGKLMSYEFMIVQWCFHFASLIALSNNVCKTNTQIDWSALDSTAMKQNDIYFVSYFRDFIKRASRAA